MRTLSLAGACFVIATTTQADSVSADAFSILDTDRLLALNFMPTPSDDSGESHTESEPDDQTDMVGGVEKSIEFSGDNCPLPLLPSANQLPTINALPDPFLMADGRRITTQADWACRRAEVKAQVEQYETGPKPVINKDNVNGRWSGNRLTVSVNDQGRSVSFDVAINRPNNAPNGPIPLMIGFSTNRSFVTLDQGVIDQNGVATATINVNAIGDQSGGGSRGQGKFYDLYGRNHPAGSLMAWAWSVSRIIDALEKTPQANIDPKRVAITGCSRYGKGALIAGAFDERIALTIPQESGAGGSASWRVSQAQSMTGENVQTLGNAAGEQPWFRADFGANFARQVTKLPYDHHQVLGMVAPRPLLVLDNRIDWLGIDSSYTSGLAAHDIWKAMGRGDEMGYWQTGGHSHCQFPASQRGILDAYIKRFLLGQDNVNTNILKAEKANADLTRWKPWSAPNLR